MIESFRHAGLEKFFRTGSKVGIQPKHELRLRLLLTTLDLAIAPENMNQTGWKFHALTGTLKDHYAVKVDGSWRVTFAFDGTNAVLVDYQNYH